MLVGFGLTHLIFGADKDLIRLAIVGSVALVTFLRFLSHQVFRSGRIGFSSRN